MKPLLSLIAFLAGPALASAEPFGIEISAGKTDRANVVCFMPLPKGDATELPALKMPDGTFIPAQMVGPSLLQKQDEARYAAFVLPKLKAGETLALVPAALPSATLPAFSFAEKKGQYIDLLFGNRPVLRYVDAPHDPANHFLTFKPFHQVFDPAEGKTLLTSGAHAKPTEGLYPHHRGLFFGFNKISYGSKQTADIWHGTDNVFSQNDQVLKEEAGRALGRQLVEISWHGKDAAAFATEHREVTAYATPGGTLIDWSTVLSTNSGPVKLDGDPQHAGFHFRATQEVAAKIEAEKALAKKEKRNPHPADTYYLRPDGKGKPGETRNWEAKTADAKTVNLPWNAMSFIVGEKRYTALRINHPDNPGETRGSERDYGRFGDYFEYTLTSDKPLRLRYRVWIQEGEMTVEECKAMAEAFVNPPEIKVVSIK